MSLKALASQGVRLASFTLVENSPSEEFYGKDVLASVPVDAALIDYVAMPYNSGPAGGIAEGLSRILGHAGEDDWVLLLDDDDLIGKGDLSVLMAFAAECVEVDPQTAGVGLSGSRLNKKKALLERPLDSELIGRVNVHYIGGNVAPMYRVSAIRKAGVFDEQLFFGGEELEFGMRLASHGFSLYVDGDLLLQRRATRGRLGLPSSLASWKVREPSWRTYYVTRNMICILRRHAGAIPALRLTARAVVKPLIQLPRHPGRSWRSLRFVSRAVVDGWTNRLGRRLDPTAASRAIADAKLSRKMSLAEMGDAPT